MGFGIVRWLDNRVKGSNTDRNLLRYDYLTVYDVLEKVYRKQWVVLQTL